MISRTKDIVTRIIPATKILQSKTNKGSVDSVAVEDAQVVLDESVPVDDLSPYFDDHCSEIAEVIKSSKNEKDHADLIEALSSSLTNFRSALVMANNVRVSRIVSEIFFLIEAIKKVDSDICEILEMYVLTLRTITKLDKPPENILDNIEAEIKAVVGRYALKHPEITIESAFENEEIEN
jgi:hypothetical protein